MGIPNKINPMTGGDILPRGYLPAEFLESTGTQYATIPFSFYASQNTVLIETLHYSTHGEEYQGEGYVNRAVQGVYDNRAFFVQADGYGKANGVVEMDAWNLHKTQFSGYTFTFFFADGSTYSSELSGQAYAYNYLLFRRGINTVWLWPGRKKYWKASVDGELKFNLIPAIDMQGVPCFYDKLSGKAFTSSGTEQFIVGMTVSQARYLCKLPIVESGALTVSLPWEAQWDTGVQNALSIAATRGWTITVQYRDPEVATKNIPIGFLESNADSLIWFTAPIAAPSAEIELDIQYTKTRSSYQAACGIAGHTGNWVAVDGTRYMLYSAIEGTNVLERSIILYKWYATPDSTVEGQSSLSVQGTTTTSFARNTTEAAGIAMLNFDNGSWNPYYSFARVWSVRAKVGDWEVKGTPRLTTKGVPVMYDVASKTEYPPTKGNNFIAGFDTAIQARKLAHLPDMTAEIDEAKKSLTVSLPWEAQLVITGVPTALQVATDRDWTITVQYRDPEADNAYYNKYAKCVTIADMFAVNSQYVADLTANDEWIYPLSSFKSGKCIFGWAYGDYPNGRPTPIKVFNADMPVATHIDGMFMRCFDLELLKGIFPKVTHATELCWGCQKLSVVEAEFPSLTYGASMFNQCQLNKESILRVLNSIPSYTSGTHYLTIGIHTDLQTDEEVLAVIADAEAKGWTLTVQWNGTATAAAASVSTFGLRSPVIYAKLVTMERPDDTTEQILDWGHYVTNWEENGYQEFSSIEEANEYFNINQTEEEV